MQKNEYIFYGEKSFGYRSRSRYLVYIFAWECPASTNWCGLTGIGRAIAKRLADAGAEVFALSKSAAYLESLRNEAASIQVIAVDLDDWEATKTVVESFGRVDLLVNNAGIAILEPFLEMKPESFDK